MLRKFFKEKWQQAIAALGIVIGVLAAAFTVGGVILTATLVTMSIYFGTMITLSRLPKEVESEWGRIKRAVLTPVVKVRNFLFEHGLALTFLMGAITGSIIGFTTVTGIVAIALGALLGDILVEAYIISMECLEDWKAKREFSNRTGLLQTCN